MIRTLLLAAGAGTRWDNYRGSPKHLAVVEGVRLLDRAALQFAELGEVEIVAPADHRYRNPWARTSSARLNPHNFEADRFASSLHRWAPDAAMVLAFGDVWFSHEALRQIEEATGRPAWSWVARFGPSEVTGCPNGEGFALVVPPEAQEAVKANLTALIGLRRQGRIDRAIGWDLYRRLEGLALDDHGRGPGLVEVDDWTDDFDSPADFDRWTVRHQAAGFPL